MKTVQFYHKDTGIIHPNVLTVADEESVRINTPEDHLPIEVTGSSPLDALSKRIDIETIGAVDYQPPSPAEEFQWNTAIKRWEKHPDIAMAEMYRQDARRRIAELEAMQARPLRELALGFDVRDRLLKIESEIATLRESLWIA